MTVNEQTNSFLIVASVFSTLTQIKPTVGHLNVWSWSGQLSPLVDTHPGHPFQHRQKGHSMYSTVFWIVLCS